MEERRIPSLLLYIVFQQVQELMGEKSLAMLLRQGGLSDYLTTPPPADESPSITVQEYATLLAHIYEIFGSRGARAIFTQGGQEIHRPDDKVSVTSIAPLREAAPRLGVEFTPDEVNSPEEVVAAIETLPRDAAIFLVPVPGIDSHLGDIAEAATERDIAIGTYQAGYPRARGNRLLCG